MSDLTHCLLQRQESIGSLRSRESMYLHGLLGIQTEGSGWGSEEFGSRLALAPLIKLRSANRAGQGPVVEIDILAWQG